MPLKTLSPSDLHRFWSKVSSGPDCWGWLASRCKAAPGYGQIKIGKTMEKAHRVSWFIHNGPITEGLEVCHSCDNPVCSNPKHLFLGTHAENMKDMQAKGRQQRLTHPRNRLSAQDVKDIRGLRGKLSNLEIADMFGISNQHVSRIQLGQRKEYV